MRIALLILIIALSSCRQAQQPFNAEQKANVITEVRSTLNNYHEDIRKNGLKAEFNYLDTSGDFFWVPPGYTVAINYDSVATILERNAPMFKSVSNSWDTLKIIPLSLTLVNYTGRLKSVITDTTGHVTSASLIETGILIKRPRGWKLLSGQTSLISQ